MILQVTERILQLPFDSAELRQIVGLTQYPRNLASDGRCTGLIWRRSRQTFVAVALNGVVVLRDDSLSVASRAYAVLRRDVLPLPCVHVDQSVRTKCCQILCVEIDVILIAFGRFSYTGYALPFAHWALPERIKSLRPRTPAILCRGGAISS